MSPQTNYTSHLETFSPNEIVGYQELKALALNLLWSWNHCGDKVWQELDSELWKQTQNPWVVLQTVSRDILKVKLADPNFRKIINSLSQANKLKTEGPAWFQQKYPKTPLSCIAYFCMEYMLSEALPIYSGGLGNVAGDQLKTASDLGVPVIAIGLLYQQGYFRQLIDNNGVQQAFYPFNDPGQLPITPLRKANGEWLRLEIALPGWSVWLRAWEVKVGRRRLYLLDSNDAANFPPHRGITSELYGGGTELRLKQELVLGIGGYRLLDALGIKPEVCHLNECHAAFVVLERTSKLMQEKKILFEEAFTITRAGNHFTSHTAVAAGFDCFSPSMMEQYLAKYAEEHLGISFHDFLALGRKNPNDPNENFNMAYLAISGSGAINGVSKLHAEVSRQLFAPIFPHWPENEVPVGHVTNGVHMPSWDSMASDNLWTDACGKTRWLNTNVILEEDIRKIPDNKIWEMRNSGRKTLIEFTRDRTTHELTSLGASQEDIENAKTILDANILVLGFARRFATYKRPDLLLHNPERLLRILNNTSQPVQLIIAGKAHPEDELGKKLIQKWIEFIKRPEAKKRVVFISDYDLLITEKLVQGVDVWINTPRRPWEACGTSGMKVLVNGGLNLSELDGWWAEAYTPEVGWAIGDGNEHGEDPSWDAAEAEVLYDLLEKEIIPLYYNRDNKDMPSAWIKRIRESMARLTPRFSAVRTVQEYTDKYYIPAAKAYCERSTDKNIVKQILAWKHELKDKWQGLQFRETKMNTVGKNYEFEVQINLNGLDRNFVEVELYAESQPKPIKMTYRNTISNDRDIYLYHASVPAMCPASDYTPRIIPYHPNVSVPLEANEILWQK